MSDIVHLFWRPETTDAFIQHGHFYLWLETDTANAVKAGKTKRRPRQPDAARLQHWLKTLIGVTPPSADFIDCSLPLPTRQGAPLPCPELSLHSVSETQLWDEVELSPWTITCYRLSGRPLNVINDLHFRLIFQGEGAKPGSDFLFWYYFTQSLRSILLKEQYIPALRYREQASSKKPYAVYAGWEYLSAAYDDLLAAAAERMPPAAAPGYEAASLLRHCAEVLLRQAAGRARITQAVEKKLADSWLVPACRPNATEPWLLADNTTLGRQWAAWRKQLAGAHGEHGFCLGLQLYEAAAEQPDTWYLQFRLVSQRDPSLQLALADYWQLSDRARQSFAQDVSGVLEQRLLLDLGQAARIYPALWPGLESAQPDGIALSLEDAFAFLTETAWVLEDAGFRVSVPAWWTPQGRRRAKLRMRPAAKAKQAAAAQQGLLSLEQLLAYRYELTLGGETLSETEWQQLVDAKTPLVQFRGQWVVLDRERMQDMLDFWRQQGDAEQNLDMRDWLKRSAEEAEIFEIDPAGALAEMLEKLRNPQHLQAVGDPPGLNAVLRDYQKRGVAWLGFLEQLGLCGCLADDMGLGKTMQVIARLLVARGESGYTGPTLLIAPTSVLGNWRKEIERFAPQLATLLHHGSQRCKDAEAFAAATQDVDVVIVSYQLLLRDAKLFQALKWRRIVLDEAQNIKNPEAKQTKAIVKLDAEHRLALTGTPVENRLLDLWSIFNFLNPGYLGKQSAFR
ncbi:MAG: DEAD/DEAH box helicase, partial [Gammaproteobacteria bacterium]